MARFHYPLPAREAAYYFARACSHAVAECRSRDEFEARIALARYAYGAPATLGEAQIELWFRKEQQYRAAKAIRLFEQLRTRHRMPPKLKPRRAFKRARTN